MRFASIIDVSLVDVPKIPVTVIFLAGCNFDCPYCQNAEIIPVDSGTELSPEEIASRASGFLTDGYCITGGDPTTQKELPDLIGLLKSDPDKHMNLNSQGSVPSVLERSLPFLDSVWFDVKTAPEKYKEVVRTKTDPWSRVRKSIELIMDSDADFWPRTTYVGGLMSADDIREILDFLSEIGFKGEYLIQNYMESSGTREGDVEGFYQAPESEVAGLVESAPSGIGVRLEWR
jgi:pyruvate formate lyase activating enzyme